MIIVCGVFPALATGVSAPSPVLGVGTLFKRGGPGWGKSTTLIPLLLQYQNSPPLTRRGRGGWNRYSDRYRYSCFGYECPDLNLLQTSMSSFHSSTGIRISPTDGFRTWMSGRALPLNRRQLCGCARYRYRYTATAPALLN